jgi:hypothetical protein
MEDVIKILENNIQKIEQIIIENDNLRYNHIKLKEALEKENQILREKKIKIQDAIVQLALTN